MKNAKLKAVRLFATDSKSKIFVLAAIDTFHLTKYKIAEDAHYAPGSLTAWLRKFYIPEGAREHPATCAFLSATIDKLVEMCDGGEISRCNCCSLLYRYASIYGQHYGATGISAWCYKGIGIIMQSIDPLTAVVDYIFKN